MKRGKSVDFTGYWQRHVTALRTILAPQPIMTGSKIRSNKISRNP
jgi:hypothetical protein